MLFGKYHATHVYDKHTVHIKEKVRILAAGFSFYQSL